MPSLKQVLITAGALLVVVTATNNLWQSEGTSVMFQRHGVISRGVQFPLRVFDRCATSFDGFIMNSRKFVFNALTTTEPKIHLRDNGDGTFSKLDKNGKSTGENFGYDTNRGEFCTLDAQGNDINYISKDSNFGGKLHDAMSRLHAAKFLDTNNKNNNNNTNNLQQRPTANKRVFSSKNTLVIGGDLGSSFAQTNNNVNHEDANDVYDSDSKNLAENNFKTKSPRNSNAPTTPSSIQSHGAFTSLGSRTETVNNNFLSLRPSKQSGQTATSFEFLGNNNVSTVLFPKQSKQTATLFELPENNNVSSTVCPAPQDTSQNIEVVGLIK